MVSLKLQKRLAASVLQCGLRKVWLDPNEVNEISMANSRAAPLRLSISVEYGLRHGVSVLPSAPRGKCTAAPSTRAWGLLVRLIVSERAVRARGEATGVRCVPCIAVALAPTGSHRSGRSGAVLQLSALQICWAQLPLRAQPPPCHAVCRPKHPEACQGRLRNQEAAEDPLASSGKDGGRGEGEGSPHWLRCDLMAQG